MLHCRCTVCCGWWQIENATAQEPPRDLTASLEERERGSRVEFDEWRKARPNFTSKELLDQWADIRIAWGISNKNIKKKVR